MNGTDILSNCRGFEWDKGNCDKNWVKHQVAIWECEQIFFNHPLVITEDTKHSTEEERFYALGRTDLKRTLLVVFAVRREKIRIISARDMNRKERRIYEDYKE